MTNNIGGGSPTASIEAFDASGSTDCSGAPKTCSSLWTATVSTGSGASVGDMAVANNILYAVGGLSGGSSVDVVLAYDAAGTTNCGGTPKTCRPLWSTTNDTGARRIAVDNGTVFVAGSNHSLDAFDAAGKKGCSGTPTVCSPLWNAQTGATSGYATLAVADGKVFVAGGSGSLDAFDESGTTNFSGTPKVCTPLWNTAPGVNDLAVANGIVYITTGPESSMWPTVGVGTLDANGVTGCSGTPPMCTGLWNTAPPFWGLSSSVIANGVVLVGVSNGGPTPGGSAIEAFGLP